MRYQLTPIHCRPWTVRYLSVKLIESHYENNYGGALRRLNAITEKLGLLDWALHGGRPLGVEGDRRADQTVFTSVISKHRERS